MLSTAAGCHPHVDATLVHPAQLPVAAYAPVVVVSGEGDAERDLAAFLASGLRRAGIASTSADRGATGAARDTIGVTLQVGVSFSRRTDTRWGTRAENVCSPYGCYVRQVSFPYDVVTVAAELRLRILEGAEGALLGERTARAESTAGDTMSVRRSLVQRLAATAVGWCVPRTEPIRIRFPRSEGDEIDRARALVEAGRSLDAANLLETFRDTPAFAAWSTGRQAEFLGTLSRVLELAAGADGADPSLYVRALAALDASIDLVDDPEFRRRRQILAYEVELVRIGVDAGDADPSDIEVPESYR